MPTLAELRTPELMSNARTIGVAQRAELAPGRHTTPPVALASDEDVVSFKWDIADHGEGHPAAMLAAIECSLDDGASWKTLCAFARERGMAPDADPQCPSDVAWVQVFEPEVPEGADADRYGGLPAGKLHPRRMVRGVLMTDAPVTTTYELVPASRAKLSGL
jgi:hypothetical protein